MSKISTYNLADTPLQLSDRLIGTEAPRPTPTATPLATKNFSLGELLQLFSSNFPAASLQAVLDTNNTATEDINLTGTINTTLIKPGNIIDMLNSQGTPLQILSKGVGGICWIDGPNLSGYVPTSRELTINGVTYDLSENRSWTIGTGTQNLQEVTDEGNVTTNPIFIPELQLYDAANDAYAKINYFDGQYNFSDINGRVFKVFEKDGLEQTLNQNDFVLSKGINSLTANRQRTEPDKDGTYAMLDDILPSAWKEPAELLLLNADVVQSGGMPRISGLTIQGHTLVQGSRVVVTEYNVPAFNGIYRVAAGPLIPTGQYTLTRTNDANSTTELNNAVIGITNGTFSGKTYRQTTANPVINTTAINFVDFAVTSVGMTVPSAFNVTPSTITSSGTFAITGAGSASQYVRGDGTLANFPTSTGGGASVSYYLNGSVSQGTIGGVAFKEMNSVPVIGAGTDFTINTNGYIAQFITDAGDPNKLLIPAGNWNFETYFSASSGGGSPRFYIELYKYDGSVFTLIASNSATPKLINDGTSIEAYFSALAVPPTTLLATDRLAVRFYVINSGRTITMHTENSHLCQVITTFSTGLTALNGLTQQVQYFAVGTSGIDFNISSVTDTHTFNLPTASAINRGALSSADWTTFNNKQNALINPVTGTGVNGQVAFWNGTTTQAGSTNLTFSNDRLTLNRTADSRFFLQENNVTVLQLSATAGVARVANVGVGNLELWSNGQSRITIFPNANVGINTTTDSGFRLDVIGVTRLNGNTSIGAATGGARLDVRAQGALSTDIAFRVRNSADNANLLEVAGNGSTLLNGLQTLQGTVASDTASLGTELLTTGTGDASWTGTSFATGYTHIVGSVTTLTSTLAAVIGTFYQITYTVTGRTAGSFTIAFGGSSTAGITATGAAGPLASTTGTLVITPTTDFNGTIVLSIRTIGTSSATTTFRSSNGTASNEIRVSNITSNTFIGLNAGRRNTTGNSNTANGRDALASNTTGGSNTANGVSALASNTTGNSNTANGVNALQNNTTGFSNTANGTNSLSNNTTGFSNTANGSSALASNTTGFSNTANGVNAGRFIADGTTANTITNNSVFLGTNTRALADNQTNQIVIGNDAIGLGSNSVVLGNASIVSTLLRGNVGIGLTAAASARLQVNGGDIIVNNGGTGVLRGDNPNLGTGGALRVSSSNTASSQFIQLGQALSGTGAFTPYMTVLSSSIVGIGTVSPVNSAQLQIDSTTRGFLPPRMTNAQRLAIASPAVGLIVYCTDMVEGLYVNKSTGWQFII